MELLHNVFENRDCNIHYWLHAGSTSKHIIFLHGAGCDHRMFEPQLPIFDDSYNLLSLDARGHGLSGLSPDTKFRFDDMLDDFYRLCERHQISDAVLIGQSMGGNLAQEALRRRPDLVSRLVLIDCTRNAGRLSAVEKLTLKLTRPIFYCYPWQTLTRQSADACGNTEAVKEYVRECFTRMKKADFIEVMMSLMTCLREEAQYRFPKPVLLLCGVDDRSGHPQDRCPLGTKRRQLHAPYGRKRWAQLQSGQSRCSEQSHSRVSLDGIVTGAAASPCRPPHRFR